MKVVHPVRAHIVFILSFRGSDLSSRNRDSSTHCCPGPRGRVLSGSSCASSDANAYCPVQQGGGLTCLYESQACIRQCLDNNCIMNCTLQQEACQQSIARMSCSRCSSPSAKPAAFRQSRTG